MTELTDEQLAITEKLAEFMGWKHKPFDGGIVVYRGSKLFRFEPFTDLRDARLLLVECDRRGLMMEVALRLYKIGNSPDWRDPRMEGIADALLFTAKQQTLAVWEVVEKLNKEKGGA